MKRDFVYLIIIVALLLAGHIGCDPLAGNSDRLLHTSVGRIDTLVIRDTIRDTVLIPKKVFITRIDTIIIQDTLRFPIPIEEKIYQTTDYRAVIEGFRPQLTELELYPKTVHITHRPRWSLGVQAGVGLSTKGSPAPYIGIGVQYNLLYFR